MNEITEYDVLAYKVGQMTDPQERQAVEHAREFDPLVLHWFNLLSGEDEQEAPETVRQQAAELAELILPKPHPNPPSPVGPRSRVVCQDGKYRSQDHVEWALALDSGEPGPHTTKEAHDAKALPIDEEEALDLEALPIHEIDTKRRLASFVYRAGAAPYGVARVSVQDKTDNTVLGTTLTVFRNEAEGDELICRAELPLAILGVPRKKNSSVNVDDPCSDVNVYVVFADNDNLHEFTIAEIEKLRARYEADWDLCEPIDRLLARLKGELDE